MIDQAGSGRQQELQRLLLTKESEYDMSDGVATLTRRRHKQDAVDLFCNNRNFKRVLAYATALKWYRSGSQWSRHYVLNDGKDNEDYTLIMYKGLVEVSQEIYYRLSTNPAFIGVTKHPLYLYYKKYFDELVGVNVDADEDKDFGDTQPNMEKYSIANTNNDEVIIHCKELQLMAFG